MTRSFISPAFQQFALLHKIVSNRINSTQELIYFVNELCVRIVIVFLLVDNQSISISLFHIKRVVNFVKTFFFGIS